MSNTKKKTSEIKKKGRMPKAVAEKKQAEGKRMFVNGFTLSEIADILGVYIDTVKSWHVKYEWEKARNIQSISINAIKEEILKSFAALKRGEEPLLSPDKISKLVAALEKLSDKKKNLAYMYENYELLTDELIKVVLKFKTKKDKEAGLKMVNQVRKVMDDIINRTYKEAMNE